MRIGNKTDNEFFLELNKINDKIQEKFLNNITYHTRYVKCDVMLGDSTIKQVESFDIKNVEDFFSNFVSKLSDWNSQGISNSSDEDLRRIFTKFEIKLGNYIISLHMSLQYHVLLYYKPIQKVMELQKELVNLMAKDDSEKKYEEEGDLLIIEKLKQLGYADMSKQKLFELFFNDEQLAEKIKNTIDTSQSEVIDIQVEKNEIFKKLDNLLLETFQTSPVLIDEQKLVNGEEGSLCNIDLEFIENGAKQGLIDSSIISEETKIEIKSNIERILKVMI